MRNEMCFPSFAKMKDNFLGPIYNPYANYSLNVESYEGQISISFRLTLYLHKNVFVSLCAFFAHRGKMEVKINKAWITADNETCSALNY